MALPSIKTLDPINGRQLKEDNTYVNVADSIEALYNALVVNKDAGIQLTGSNGGQVTVTNGKLDVNAQVTVGAVATGETIVTAPLTRVVTLTDTPVSLTSKSNLRQITVRNIDPVLRSRIGETGMTAANGKGIALEPQAVYQESFDPTIPVTIYGRSEGASMQVEVYEA